MKDNKVSLITLYISFFSVGAITFGGGYAMLPFLERELCDNKKWITSDQLFDFYAIAQCTPGVIAINVATYIGYNKRGFLGAICASLGVISPSIIIITIITAVFKNFQNNIYVIRAISGIKIVVCAMMTHTIYKMIKKSIVDKTTFILFIIALISIFIFNINIIIIIISSILLGLIINQIKRSFKHAN